MSDCNLEYLVWLRQPQDAAAARQSMVAIPGVVRFWALPLLPIWAKQAFPARLAGYLYDPGMKWQLLGRNARIAIWQYENQWTGGWDGTSQWLRRDRYACASWTLGQPASNCQEPMRWLGG